MTKPDMTEIIADAVAAGFFHNADPEFGGIYVGGSVYIDERLAKFAQLQRQRERTGEAVPVAKSRLKRAIFDGDRVVFNDKVINGLDDAWQSYSVELYFYIPYTYEYDRHYDGKPPSMTEEQAVDEWLDEIFKEE
jgi:hypothetical protein